MYSLGGPTTRGSGTMMVSDVHQIMFWANVSDQDLPC